MANSYDLEKLRQGLYEWNRWRSDTLAVPDLSDVYLAGIFRIWSQQFGTLVSNANFANVNMAGSDLREAQLVSINFSRSNLNGARLSGANLTDANLTKASLNGADLFEANLRGANLSQSRLVNTKLQRSNLDRANLTGAILWETQRAGWSIKNVVCDYVYWDKEAEIATEYKLGEFEQLHAEQSIIELHYPGGISSFEINTLPALLHHLASKHPGLPIHLKTIEATGGGTKVTISVGETDNETKSQVEADAIIVLKAQLSLREDEVRRLQFERGFFERQLSSMTNALIASAGAAYHFHAPVNTAVLPSGNAKVELHQTFFDNTELIRLIDKLLTRNTELTSLQSSEIEAAKAELQKSNPDKSFLSRTLNFLKSLPKEAILKGAGKLGEKAAETDWSSLLDQLGQLVHHMH